MTAGSAAAPECSPDSSARGALPEPFWSRYLHILYETTMDPWFHVESHCTCPRWSDRSMGPHPSSSAPPPPPPPCCPEPCRRSSACRGLRPVGLRKPSAPRPAAPAAAALFGPGGDSTSPGMGSARSRPHSRGLKLLRLAARSSPLLQCDGGTGGDSAEHFYCALTLVAIP